MNNHDLALDCLIHIPSGTIPAQLTHKQGEELLRAAHKATTLQWEQQLVSIESPDGHDITHINASSIAAITYDNTFDTKEIPK